jgi:hypothetical protein
MTSYREDKKILSWSNTRLFVSMPHFSASPLSLHVQNQTSKTQGNIQLSCENQPPTFTPRSRNILNLENRKMQTATHFKVKRNGGQRQIVR